MSNNQSDAYRWDCTGCGQSTADQTGYLSLSGAALATYERSEKEWKAKYGRQFILDGAALLAHPSRVEWLPWHADCDRARNDMFDYLIEVERIRTPGRLLSWSAHLGEKNWHASTKWPDLIRSQLTPADLAC